MNISKYLYDISFPNISDYILQLYSTLFKHISFNNNIQIKQGDIVLTYNIVTYTFHSMTIPYYNHWLKSLNSSSLEPNNQINRNNQR